MKLVGTKTVSGFLNISFCILNKEILDTESKNIACKIFNN